VRATVGDVGGGGARQLTILEAELASHERRGWVEVNV